MSDTILLPCIAFLIMELLNVTSMLFFFSTMDKFTYNTASLMFTFSTPSVLSCTVEHFASFLLMQNLRQDFHIPRGPVCYF